MTTTGKVECVDGGPAHAWSSGGLATNSRSQLVTIRRCLSCHTEEEKRYGAGGTVPWRPRGDARPAAPTAPETPLVANDDPACITTDDRRPDDAR